MLKRHGVSSFSIESDLASPVPSICFALLELSLFFLWFGGIFHLSNQRESLL